MKANNAVVFLWKGDTIPDYLAKKLAELLYTNGICIPEMLTVKVLDEEGIVKILLNEASQPDTSILMREETSEEEAVKHAIVYIGKRFETSLKRAKESAGNIAPFIIALSDAVRTVPSEEKLLTAVEIISTRSAVIPASLAKKYHISQTIVDAIRNVYKHYH